MILVGLTGGIASGKSTVSNILKNVFLCPVIDADLIARQVVEPGRKAYDGVVKEFGKEILYRDGTINREKLGKIIFSDTGKRRKLNAITHPEIGKAIFWQIVEHFVAGHRFIILDVPLLFESKTWTKMTSFNVVVYCKGETQLQRLMDRNELSENEAKQRIDSQFPLEEKKKLADIVINNDGTLEETYNQVEKFYQDLLTSKRYIFIRLIFLAALAGFSGLLYKFYSYLF